MKTELLRHDEREAVKFPVGHVMLFVDRLIEERETVQGLREAMNCISNQRIRELEAGLENAMLEIVRLQAELGDGIH